MAKISQPNPEAARIIKEQRNQKNAMRADIKKIDNIVSEENSKDALVSLHRELDGKYGAAIKGWGKSMWAYYEKFGFSYDLLDEKDLKDNLAQMKSKIEGFVLGFNTTDRITNNNNTHIDIKNENSNEVNVTITFENAIEQIKEMDNLSDDVMKEIIDKINELKRINEESISKKEKWTKIKDIVTFSLNEGPTVGNLLLKLITQMLG